MQVAVTANGLERQIKVDVPAQRIDQEVQNRLVSLQRRVRVDGFRPGKVPFKVVQSRFGSEVRQEVFDEVLRSTFFEVISQERLRPAGNPQFKLLSHDPGQDLQYTATFEVYPDFEVKLPPKLKISKPLVDITDADVDKMMERLRTQRKSWVEVQRPAQKDDRILIDFIGTIGGVAISGGEAKAYPVVIGSGMLTAGFEDHLIGMQAGYSRGFDLTFPMDYRATELAGKEVHFEVTAVSVEESRLPAFDADFLKSFGVTDGGISAMKTETRRSMLRELEQAIKERIKKQVMDALMESNSITLPQALVDDELGRMKQQLRAGAVSDDAQLLESSRHRVTLGLIIAEIVRKNQFKVDPSKLRAQIEAVAASYDDPAEVIRWYYGNQERLTGVEALLLEDQAVEWVVSQAEVTLQPLNYYDVVGEAI